MNCAIYARYSSDLQKDKSIEDQIRNCREFANGKGWKILEPHVYADKAISGASMARRTQLQELMKTAGKKPKPFDYLLIDDTSRLSRNKIDQAQFIEEFSELGIQLCFVSQNIDTSDEQSIDILLPMHGIVDGLYIKELAKKTRRGMEGQVRRGYNAGGRTFGYSYEPEVDPSGIIDKKTRQPRVLGTIVSINQAEADIVRKMYDLYGAGIGLKAISTYLNDQGIAAPRNGRSIKSVSGTNTWSPHTIRYMLLNQKYYGDWSWNRTKWVKSRKSGRRRCIPRTNTEIVENPRPDLAIVSQQQWAAVQERFKTNRRSVKEGRRSPRKQFILSGLLRCSVCNGSIVVVGRAGSNDVVFGCGTSWTRGKKACTNNHRIAYSQLESAFLSAINNEVKKPDLVDQLIEKVKQQVEFSAKSRLTRQGKVSKQVLKVEAELKRLLELAMSSEKPPSTILDQMREREALLKDLKAKILTEKATNGLESLRIDKNSIVKRLSEFDLLLNGDIPHTRAAVSRLVNAVSFSPVIKHGARYIGLSSEANILNLLGLNESTIKEIAGAGFEPATFGL